MLSDSVRPTAASCPECPPVSRRSFLRQAAVGAGMASTILRGMPAAAASGAPAPRSETLVSTLYKSLSEPQRKALCFGFADPLRSKVDNNWHIVSPRVDEVLNRDQQALVREIFLHLHREEYASSILKATEHDNGERGLGACSVALFGEPGTGKFEFVLSGRHVTRRCDGDSVEGAAFGGPIFYGHSPLTDDEAPDHPQNVYWYQARRANEVFQALDGKQRDLALRPKGRRESGSSTVRLKGKPGGLEGIPFSELTRDQRELVQKVLADLLAPFRKEDADEAMKWVSAGGLHDLHLAYFKDDDLGNDGIWDVWQIESPSMVWYFRGAPHVHTWVNIMSPAAATAAAGAATGA
ncbi:MAG: DUF3500 domain-containing protein [Verrucomicrobiales bacterium]|nr:DUF3500 domain-containing protein [Verrucomicrobiales bacterium]